jgi:hypothetical protein
MTSKGLVAEVGVACGERLVNAGFRSRPGDIFTRPVASGVLGWLGLNRAVGRRDGLVEVNPVVGVRHQTVEAMVAELLGEKVRGYVPPTLSSSLGYLMPGERYQPWTFGGDVPVASTAKRLAAAVVEYGMPYIERYGSLEAIVEALSNGAGVREVAAYRLPVGYLLLGEPQRARDAIEASIRALSDRQDLAAQRFGAFASAFQRRLD